MEQRAEIDGSGNIVVQIEGDRNTVNLKGLAHLTLTRFLNLREARNDAELLSPYSRSIPLVGRRDELDGLHAWLDLDKAISVRVLTGQAGAGKTRLALEVCETMLVDGWDAGFVESGEFERFRNQQNPKSWGWRRPTLVVIDYAAVQAKALGGWLQELASNPGDAEKPLRILLLERHADVDSGWWQTVFGRGGWGAKGVEKLLDPADPVPLVAISTDDRREVLNRILSQKGATARLRTRAPTWPLIRR
jgi:hypothetical protein